jgi:quinohemoprotein ethanol dehydrogenase
MPSFQGHLDIQQAEAVHQYLIKRAIDLQEQLAAAKKTASN